VVNTLFDGKDAEDFMNQIQELWIRPGFDRRQREEILLDAYQGIA
jgi:hypothetical protein